MGKLKKRIYPRDVTLNLSENAPVPPSPYPDQTWKEVVSNKHVTWLAYWKDPILSRGYKYVHLAADSAWKGKSDREKYEKARELKSRIEEIRRIYTESFRSEDRKEAQIAVAIYFIDKLALRAGHEKDEDEADTVRAGRARDLSSAGGCPGGAALRCLAATAGLRSPLAAGGLLHAAVRARGHRAR